MATIYYPFTHFPQTGGDFVNIEHVRKLQAWGLNVQIALIGYQGKTDEIYEAFSDLPIFDNSKQQIMITPYDLFVVPEVFPGLLSQLADPNSPFFNMRSVLHNQNPFYNFTSFENAQQINAHPLECIIVPSEYAARRLSEMGVEKPIHIVHPYIPDYFRPKEKSQNPITIAYSSRKREMETKILSFYFNSYFHKKWAVNFVDICNVSRQQVAEILAESAIFVSFAERESLGLMALEAMASGCHVVGFDGHTGGYSEYFNENNGDWIAEGDYVGFTQKLIQAIEIFASGEFNPKVQSALEMIEQHFRMPIFEADLKRAFTAILQQNIP